MAHHHGLQVEVDQGGDQRVFEAGHHDHVEHEVVVHIALALHAAAQRVFFRRAHLVDDQHLKVGARQLGCALMVAFDLRRAIGVHAAAAAFMAVGLRGQHAVNAPHALVGAGKLGALDPGLQFGEYAATRKRPVTLDRRERRGHFTHTGFDLGPLRMVAVHVHQSSQPVEQSHPAVGAHLPHAAVAAERMFVLLRPRWGAGVQGRAQGDGV